MSEQTNEVANEIATEASFNEGVSLSLTDIQNAVKVIDFAADQGAFRGWKTIEQVLVVRERLNTFIAAANAAQGTEEAPEGEAGEGARDEATSEEAQG